MSTPNPAKKFFGHPIQLSTLFHIELWERFSFYGMQGILMIYLYYAAKEGGLGIDKTLAGGIVGAYGGSVYLSTILGGKNAVYLRHRRDARPHLTGRHPRPVRPAVWPGVHRIG